MPYALHSKAASTPPVRARESVIGFFFYASAFLLFIFSLGLSGPKGTRTLALFLEGIVEQVSFYGEDQRLEHIELVGNEYLSREALLGACQINRPGFHLKHIQAWRVLWQLERIPLVEQAWVRFDDRKKTLCIHIREKKPFARLVTRGEKAINLIDRQGHIIKFSGVVEGSLLEDLPIIEGTHAWQHLDGVIHFQNVWTQRFGDRFDIERFVYVGERRWDIVLKNKTRISLPEGGLERQESVDYIAQLEEKWGFLHGETARLLDLRLPNKVFVRHIAKGA